MPKEKEEIEDLLGKEREEELIKEAIELEKKLKRRRNWFIAGLILFVILMFILLVTTGFH